MANGLLAGIMNPAVADPVGGFQAGEQRRDQRLADEQIGAILDETIGGKLGKLARIDPQSALALEQALGTRGEKRTRHMLGLTQMTAHLIKEGVPPNQIAELLSESAAMLASPEIGIEPTQIMEVIRGLKSDDPAVVAETMENVLTLEGMLVAGGQLKAPEGAEQLQSSKTLPDGTSIQTFKDGRTRVLDPEGNEVRGDARAKAIRDAEEFGVDIQSRRAGGRTAATEEEKRASTLIEQGTLAAESVAGLRRGIDLLKTIDTGGIDAVRLRAKNLFGIETADEGELTNELATAVLSQLRETFGAQFTEREGARLERIEAGIGKSTASNIRLLNQALGIAERKANRAIKAARRRDQMDVVDDIQNLLDYRIESPEQQRPAVIEVDY